jgi:hypothetical protein
MDERDSHPGADRPSKPGARLKQGFRIAALVGIVIVIAALFWIKHNFYASPFSPTQLSSREQQVLDSKLARLDRSARKERPSEKKDHRDAHGALEPEGYSEEGASREIRLSERELNSLIAGNPEIAERVALDLSGDLLSAKVVLPVDDDILLFGGKTLRLNMGVTLGYEDNQLVVALKGVSLGGVPMPNAWLGNLKNVNLVEEFGDEGGFWHLFSAGVRDIKVSEGHLRITLKE